jgi:hypothetical protein
MAAAAVVAYIVGEGFADAASAGQTQNVFVTEPEEKKDEQ